MFEPDSPSYTLLAKGLTKGCGFARWEHGTCQAPELLRTPGYPLFLAALASPRFAIVVQAILEAGTVLVVGVAAAAVAGTVAGIVAASIFAFDVPSIANCATILSEPLFTAIVGMAFGWQIVAIFRFPDSKGRTLVSFMVAGLLGMSPLVRPIGVVLIVTVPLLLLPLKQSKSRGIWIAAVLTVIAAAPTFVWSLRNFERRGVFSLSVISQYNLYFYRAGGLLVREKGVDPGLEHAILVSEEPKSCSPEFNDSSPECFKVLERRAFQILRQHPTSLVRDMARRAATILVGPGVEQTKRMVGEGSVAANSGVAGAIVFGLVSLEIALLATTWIGALFAVVKFGLPWRWSHYPLLLPCAAILVLVLAAAGPEGTRAFAWQ